MKTLSLGNRSVRHAALLALPLALGVLAINANPFAAVPAMAATQPVFERVQFADIIAATQPAVVQITVVKSLGTVARLDGRGQGPGGSAFEEFMRRFGARPFNGGPEDGRRGKAEGVGSGFIIDPEGYIVTNNHVVSDATEIKVTLHDGRELAATRVGNDEQTDLALLKVEGENLPAIAFGDSDRTRVGEWVVAIGSPFGFGGSVTAGIVSARGRDIRSGPYDDYLQIDAPINSGNSGGPIIDASGRVIGVNTAIYSPNGGNIGIGFAIPAVDAARVISQLKDNGAVTRGRLGVQIQAISDDVASALGLTHSAGALVAEVVADGSAERAGIRAGDVITEYDGVAIEQPRDLSKAVARTEPGSKTTIKVHRQGREQSLSATIDRHTEALAAQTPKTDAATADALGLGLALGSLSPDTRRQMRLDSDASGALVLGIKAGGVAESGGIRPGDIIVQIDQVAIHDAPTAERALATAKQEKRPTIVLIRRGQEQFFTTMKVA